MNYIDVFNGDADGLCALHQLRLENPVDSELVTGVKRDIALLKRVNAQAGDEITVLDVSLDKNRDALLAALDAGAKVRYFDHHFAGEMPQHENFEAFINTDANVCTSLLVNAYLQSAYLPWAVAAAFGDNLFDSARNAAQPLNLKDEQLNQLEHLGTLLNYNGYGVTLDDLYFTPQDLYEKMKPFENPFDFIAASPAYQVLSDGYADDMEKAEVSEAVYLDEKVAAFMMPDEAWSRRVSGVYGNALARIYTDRAHALVTVMDNGNYRVSVRAPLSNKIGADELCMSFPTGGGRKAAAGINDLPKAMLDDFITAFKDTYS
ncbi:DHH family phosphoesterase [Ghiorsea bivora]|uniref:DHH family phosphoesterase n=1 Tax=Ghiorsea bivora TaxID=1485545 RepID=UPI00056E448C|nr:DHH family phosphoesterase [Ghiorsea bivora]